MIDPPRLATYVQPSLSEARIQSQWSRIAQSRPSHFAGSMVWSLASVAAVSLLVVFGVVAYRARAAARSPSPTEQQVVVERDGAGHESVTLPEGVTVTLNGEARYRLAERSHARVHLLLERGTAEFEVAPLKGRQVIVTAAGFDIEVVGTHFEVALAGQADKRDVAVRVQRGRVMVRPSGQQHASNPIRTLNAGESWSTRTDSSTTVNPEGRLSEVPSAAGSAAAEAQGPAAVASAPTPHAVTAKELFESAESARIKGRPREAAAAFDRLRHTYPSDPRAGLASFELGRLRMDQLSDTTGAVSALTDALRLDPSARFREDAQARIVQLYDRLGQVDRCRRAQTEYLARYPSGSHAKGILGLCAR